MAGAAPLRAVTDGYSGPQMVSGVGVIARLTGGIQDLNLVLIYMSFIEGGGAAVHLKRRFHSHVHGLRCRVGVGGLEEGGASPGKLFTSSATDGPRRKFNQTGSQTEP